MSRDAYTAGGVGAALIADMGGKSNAGVGNVVLYKEVLLLKVPNEVSTTRADRACIVEGHAVVVVGGVPPIETEQVVCIQVEVEVIGEVESDIGSLGGFSLAKGHSIAKEVRVVCLCLGKRRVDGKMESVSNNRESLLDEASEGGARVDDGTTCITIGGDVEGRGRDIEEAAAINADAGHVDVVKLGEEGGGVVLDHGGVGEGDVGGEGGWAESEIARNFSGVDSIG
ncbi:hypothetical protein L7F22_057277 [Adiantum nelumboides]|nr:hypothetical protein [Adiantum nelumboides]